MRLRKPVPCQHIADYYTSRWEAHKCIAWNLLRRGYTQWAEGRPERDIIRSDGSRIVGNNLYWRRRSRLTGEPG